MKTWLFTLLGVVFLFVSVSQALAQVAINEFCSNCSPEWAELYNLGSSPVDLDGWSMLFGDPNQSLVISNTNYPNRTISANGFFVLTLNSSWMNNSGDTLELFDNSSSTPQDIATYSGTIDSGNTYSRIPDGTGSFVPNTTATQGAANQPLPTSTPTPTPTLAPTPTPTSTPTPTPTSKPSPTPTKTPTPTKKPTPTPYDEIPLTTSESESTALVLSANTLSTPPPTSTPTPKQPSVSNKKSLLPLIAIIVGSLLLLLALFFFFNSKFITKGAADGKITRHD